ncbi:MAG: tetratricopeptide repeat protein [Planctomycetota bacterium]
MVERRLKLQSRLYEHFLRHLLIFRVLRAYTAVFVIPMRRERRLTIRSNAPSILLLWFCSLFLLSARTDAAPATPIPAKAETRSCSSLRSIARVYMASGSFEKAQPFLESAIDLAKRTDAPDSEMCACVLDLAYLHKNRGKLAEALKMCLLGLELQEKVHSPNHPYVAYTLRILSQIYREQARYREAVSSLDRALTIMRGAGSEQSRDVAPFKVDMARLLVIQGDFTRAESYFASAMAVIEKSYGPDHLYTTKVLTSMAKLYVLQGRYAQAEELMSRAIPVQEGVYGSNHHFLVPARLVMSRIYQAKGDLADAKALLEESLGAAKKHGDSGFLLEADVLCRLGELHISGKKYSRAEDVLQRALKVLESSQNAGSDRTAIALGSLAKVYMNQRKYAKAQSLCRKALEMLESVFDRNHPSITGVLETLVKLHRQSGDMAEAERLEQRIEEIRVSKRVAYAPVAKAIE